MTKETPHANGSPPPLREQIDVARLGEYRGYAELSAALQRLEAAGARSREIARSVNGSPVVALELGDAAAREVVVVLGGIHALEWIGVEAGLALLERLAASPPTGMRVLALPLVNVDGYRAVEADLRAGKRRFRRGNGNGVDLNRNWPTNFRRRTLASIFLPWIYSPGRAACSEPEVAGAVAAIDAVRENSTIVRALSLHSIGRKILFPYGGRWRPPDDIAPTLEAAAAMRARFHEPYHVVQAARWVPGAFAYGMELDHLHDAYGARALLVECSTGGLRLGSPGSLIHPFRWFNPPDPARVVAGLVDGLEAFVRGT